MSVRSTLPDPRLRRYGPEAGAQKMGEGILVDMPSIRITRSDLFDLPVDAYLLTIDGIASLNGRTYDAILGQLGRQYARRFPASDLLEELDSQLFLPLPLGHAARVELESGPVRGSTPDQHRPNPAYM